MAGLAAPRNRVGIRDYVVFELAEKEQIPQVFKYGRGVEEMKLRLRCKYPEIDMNELLRVLDDLIENKNNALGLGDEGDLFAPW